MEVLLKENGVMDLLLDEGKALFAFIIINKINLLVDLW